MIGLIGELSGTPARQQQELNLLVALGPALIAIQGYGATDVEHVYTRARGLCEQSDDAQQLVPVLQGLIVYYLNRGDIRTASELGKQLFDLAEAQSDPALMLPHMNLGALAFYRGEPASADAHHMQVLTLYTPQASQDLDVRFADPSVVAHSYLALERWNLGYPEQALQHSQAAIARAQELSHPWSLSFALFLTAFLHQCRREVPSVYEQTETMITLVTEQGFTFWVAYATVLHGWSLVMQGQGEQGIAEIRQGLEADRATGSNLWQACFLGLLAEAYGVSGQPEEGFMLLAEAMTMMETTEVHFYEAELFRIKGVLLLQRAVPDASQAEICFHRALDIAQQQAAKSWELRAATSLARLWHQQDKPQEARDLLGPVYEWFSEGFDTADLIDAKALLDG